MRGNAGLRRAEEFDALIAGRTADGHGYDDLLELVAGLRSLPAVEARPDFVASLRTQLVAAAEREPQRTEQELAARLTPRQRRGSRERRLAAVVGGFAVVSATGSMAMASQDALPGDVLYPVKRAIENAQTNLQPDGASKADTLLAHAAARLDEVEELTARDADAEVISATLQDFTDQTKQASEFALDDYAATGQGDQVAALRDFAADSMDVLGGLGAVVPDATRPILITATQTVRQVDAAAWEACPTCADGAIAEIPDFATLPLSAVLSGDLPGTASVSTPVEEAKPADKPTSPPTAKPTTPTVPVESPTGTPKPGVGDKVKEVTDEVGEVLDPLDPTGNETTPSLTGTLIDGVGGLLGGLLK